MNIKMYDVNWGEAILYDDGTGKILVDCGAKFHHKGDTAYSAVKGDFSFGKDALLITHFDEDHYNGVISMADAGERLDKIYIPKYLFIRKDGTLRSTDGYFAYVIYLYLLGKKTKLNSLNRLFVSMINTASSIKSVAYGDCVDFGNTSFNVIWPEEDAFLSFGTLAEELRTICIEALDNAPNLVELMDGYVNRYIEIFVDFYRTIDLYDNNGEILYEKMLSRLYAAHEDLLNYEREVRLFISKETSKVVNSKLSSFIKTQNDCSVVFCKDREVLALGDVSNKVVRRLKRSGRVADCYKYVKAPHHGTIAYYSPLLPRANSVFISNNGVVHKNWKISEEYAKKYSKKCYCTNTENDRCEWALNGNPCCQNCNISTIPPANPRCLTI